MKSIAQNAAPNIIAGVNFNTDRFAELFAWMTTLTADSVQALLLPYQYGLVLPYDGKTALELHQTGNQLSLSRCSAITKGGVVIGIFEGITPIIEASIPAHLQPQQTYYVVLEADVSQRKTFGANSVDSPERPQFSMPFYQLGFRAVSEDLGIQSNVLRIGLLAYTEGNWALQNYIPPCMHLGADAQLMQKYNEYQAALNQLLDYLPKIIQQTDSYKDAVGLELREFCLQIGSFLAQKVSDYSNLTPYGKPYYLFQLWSNFAGLVDFLLKRLSQKRRFNFYELLSQNTKGTIAVNFQANHFEDSLKELATLLFMQHDILLAIQKTDTVLKLIVPLFRSISSHFIPPSEPIIPISPTPTGQKSIDQW